MAGKVNFKELQELQKRLQQTQNQIPQLIQEIVDDISNEFLQEVKQRTPASDNNKLKNNWKKRVIAGKNGSYTVEIYNDLEYASSIEYGHKTESNGFKQGHFMMTITQQDIENRMNSLVQPKLEKALKGVFK